MASSEGIRSRLARGLVIPALPLALDSSLRLDERRQVALMRYYKAAGAGGVAVGVHTTQFAIRDPAIGLFRPLLELASHEMRDGALVRIAGICGPTHQALHEAETAQELGYDAGLLSLGAMAGQAEPAIVTHCREVARIIKVLGFYLQPRVGGRILSYEFWRAFAEIENVVGIKIAPFNRYQTLDVVRAVTVAGRDDIALYTGNDDHIILDLLTPFRIQREDGAVERRIVGGLLGHWAVWTRRAVEHLAACRQIAREGGAVPIEILRLANDVTDANGALFDASNEFAGCIAGVHEVLRRQGFFEEIRCLDARDRLSPGQLEEINRVCRQYPHLTDDAFVAEHLDGWLRG
jgi:hypothetical protein